MAQNAELRIALVCYGGVSLAIYMHGITKELHKLVRASRAFDEMLANNSKVVNPFVDDTGTAVDTEGVYFEVLSRLNRDGRPLSVGIDIIAGTSAGGINGVVLSKAIAQNADQGQLKQLWIEHADLRELLRWRIGGTLRFRIALAATVKIVTFWSERAVLNGGLMSRLLYRALADMDANGPVGWSANSPAPVPDTLIPPGGELSLFVTTTDLKGFDVAVASSNGGVGQRDRQHAQVLQFLHDGDNPTAFGPDATPTLSFAARATSAFPGAFEPVNTETFPAEADCPPGTTIDIRRFRYSYPELGLQAERTWFADGGVLDNAPFDLVVDAIARRRAATQVYRRLVYLEPDPGCELTAPPADTNDGVAQPNWAKELRKILTGIRGSRSLVPDLIRLRDMNERIAEVGAISTQQEVEVLDHISAALTSMRGTERPTPRSGSYGLTEAIDATPEPDFFHSEEDFRELFARMHAQAVTALGSTWNTYQRLKADTAARCLADAIVEEFALPGESGTAVFIRCAIASWLRNQPYWSAANSKDLSDLLQGIDTPYRHRRLLFIVAGLNQLYTVEGGPPREDINNLKGQAWEQLEKMAKAPRAAVAAMKEHGLLSFLNPVQLQQGTFQGERFTAPEDFAHKASAQFNDLFKAYSAHLRDTLENAGQRLWKPFADTTPNWTKRDRILLASRYLGFALWDGLLFPTISLSELPQFTPIPLVQFSPLRATTLKPPDGEGKLKGVALHHFGAFAHAPDRENDYLWGRLDAVELILRTIDETFPKAHPVGRELLPRALSAVLATETDLKRIPQELTASLHEQITALEAENKDGTARWQ
ncbi:hypothetical protein JMUB6875_60900 [Nocardia sp. JMUB6875]|uniref:patatin-like protein n=1 Tax=Nocardia sp. JMUB6875 TaxID=3158170 RepID=UPI0032E661A0